MKANQAAGLREDEGVTDVLGTILMVGITVGMMVGLSILILSFEGPGERYYADLQFDIGPGDYSWGDGNEEVLLRHVGGESIRTDDLTIVLTINGTATQYPGSAQGGDLADGVFAIGDIWQTVGLTIPANATVETMVVSTSLNQVIGSNALVADLTLAAGTPPVFTYVQEAWAVEGSLGSFSAAQDGNDAGASATLMEASSVGAAVSSGAISPLTKSADFSTVTPGQVLTSNNLDAVQDGLADSVTVTDFDMPTDIQSITAVRIGFEGAASGGGGNDPVLRVTYSHGALPDPSPADFAVVGTTDLTYETTITSDYSWTVSDLRNLQVSVVRQSADASFKDANIDHIYMEIDYIQTAQWSSELVMNFTGVPSSSLWELQVRYAAVTDDYVLQVWDGSAWGSDRLLTSSSSALSTIQLSTAQWQTGNPQIRFIDSNTESGQGQLDIDYARVVSV